MGITQMGTNTEYIVKSKNTIDKMHTSEAIRYMIKDQYLAINSIEQVVSKIETIIERVVIHLKKYPKSRIIYTGAGTSARIGVQDGVEIFPTFGWPQSRVKFIVAGGKKAIFKAIENAEDNISSARKEVEKINVNEADIVVGLLASGTTPFTIEVLKSSKRYNALTIAIINNKNNLLNEIVDYCINLKTGSEVIAGSTRLKAGTSQKVFLNIFSTIIFTKLGYVKNGMMVNMKPTNLKLRKRKKLIDTMLFENK